MGEYQRPEVHAQALGVKRVPCEVQREPNSPKKGPTSRQRQSHVTSQDPRDTARTHLSQVHLCTAASHHLR